MMDNGHLGKILVYMGLGFGGRKSRLAGRRFYIVGGSDG